MWQKMEIWKNKFLSQVRKEVLIKAVLQAIPTFTMSVFKLSRILCKKLNTLCSKFWWGYKDDTRKMHWWSWEKMSVQKRKEGMGFSDLKSFNSTMLAK